MAIVPGSADLRGLKRWTVYLLGLAGVSGVAWFFLAKQPQPSLPSQMDGSPQEVGEGQRPYSNIRHADYVGPGLCNDCHEDRYQEWQSNLHRKMNRLASEAGAVMGDFENRRVPYADGVLVLSHEGGDYFMSFSKADKITRRYRVTRTIGSRYLQEYVGVLELGPEPIGDSAYSTEIRLPFGYLFRTKRWLPQQYFDSWHGAEYTGEDKPSQDTFEPDKAPWRGRCAWCHNTYSFDKRLARLQGDTQIGNGIEQFYVDDAKADPAISESNLLPVDELVTVGISCESCHFGAREHAVDGKKPHFAPHNEKILANPGAPGLAGTREDSRTIVAICAQCHSAPTALYPNGAGTRNSSEALDLLSGACATRIKCTDCHNPHVPGPGAMAPVQQEHVKACLGCHPDFSDTTFAREHSKHSEEVSCLDCHMPRIVQGISSLVRSHRIGSPTNSAMLETSVNACNLCHLDKSVVWTALELRQSYGKGVDVSRLTDVPAAKLWLSSKERIHRLTAAGSIPLHSSGRAFLPELLEMLNDPVAYDRQRYLWAIEELLGRTLAEDEFALLGTPQWRRNQVLKLRKVLKLQAPKKAPPAL